MNLPPLTAELSVYQSVGTYFASNAFIGSLLRGTYCDDNYRECISAAEIEYENAIYRCNLLNVNNRTNVNCNSFALSNRDNTRQACAERYLCTSNDCGQDIVSPFNFRCCPSGQQVCNGGCVANCSPRKRILINDTSCACVCDPLLQECDEVLGGQIRDPETCLCRCPTEAERPCAVVGAHRDLQKACVCSCDDPLVPCAGRCVDLRNDKNNCGSCGNVCSQFGGGCCEPDATHTAPYCDPPFSNQHCGRCLAAKVCPAGLRCCATENQNADCFNVDTSDTHCGECGNACRSPATCVGGSCVCPQGRPPCEGTDSHGPLICCASSTATRDVRCCNNPPPNQGLGCYNVKWTGANPHCGQCDNACRSPATCVNGVCVCPSGRSPCGLTDMHGPDCCDVGYTCVSTPWRATRPSGCCPTYAGGATTYPKQVPAAWNADEFICCLSSTGVPFRAPWMTLKGTIGAACCEPGEIGGPQPNPATGQPIPNAYVCRTPGPPCPSGESLFPAPWRPDGTMCCPTNSGGVCRGGINWEFDTCRPAGGWCCPKGGFCPDNYGRGCALLPFVGTWSCYD